MRMFFAALAVVLAIAMPAGAATKLEIVDYIPYRVLCTDGAYLYGIGAGATHNVLYRFNSIQDTSPVQVHDFTSAYNIIGVWQGVSPGHLFVACTKVATNKSALYKSTDYGATFSTVLLFGDTDGTETNQIANVYVLGKGVLVTGGVVYVGEYNVNASRTPGGANDQVRLLKSTDNGDTFTEVTHWNTDGSHTNIRHIHLVQTDGNWIFIGSGDSDSESMILRWDKSTTIAANHMPSWYTDNGAKALAYDQRYRTGDILFPPGNYAFYSADNDGVVAHADPNDTRGIWRFNKTTMASAERVNSDITNYVGRSGWYGALLPDGTMMFSEFFEATGNTTNNLANIYTSSDGGASWRIVATSARRLDVFGQGAFNIFNLHDSSLGDVVVFDNGATGAGKNDHSTLVLQARGQYAEDSPVIVHPVYWVSTTGTDAVSPGGSRPSNPWHTLAYALSGSRITYGGRVIVAAGTYPENKISCLWSGNSFPSSPANMTVVEGAGRAGTTVYQNDTQVSFLVINRAATPVKFKNMTMYSTNSGAFTQLVEIQAHAVSRWGKAYFEDMTLGNKSYAINYLFLLSEAIEINRCLLLGENVTRTTAIQYASGTVNGSALVTYSIFDGFKEGIHFQGSLTSDLSAYNNVFYGYSFAGIRPTSSAKTYPVVKNNIFVGATGAQSPYYNESGLNTTGAYLDYNSYSGVGYTPLNCTAQGGTHKLPLNTNPKLKDPTNGDYHILAGSPCIGTGDSVGLSVDFDTKHIRGYPDIGAYEYQLRTTGGFGWTEWIW